MNKFSKYGQSRLLIGLVSMLSMSFATSAVVESNPQSCGMISTIKKKNKSNDLIDEDFLSTDHTIKS
jgi:hypothetical protein